MESTIARCLALKTQPIAVCKSKTAPADALSPRDMTRRCMIESLSVAAGGRAVALQRESIACPGGRVGCGFQPFQAGIPEYFLSDGSRGPRKGEFYKKTPEHAAAYLRTVPHSQPEDYLLLLPLSQVTEQTQVLSVIFLVNADQLSALATLANYDMMEESGVQLRFGAGCAQSILFPLCDEEAGRGHCTIGLTDPTARKAIAPDLLSFGVPYHRFLTMEENAAGSFLTKEDWQTIRERIP